MNSTDLGSIVPSAAPAGRGLRTLAALMRRTPHRVRRLGWWWTLLYERIGGGGFEEDAAVDHAWPKGLQAPVRLPSHGYRMALDLSDWLERRAYFCGGLYQPAIEDACRTLLREGEAFVDIGANLGFITLLGARCVGRAGTVIAFEPNPEPHARLHAHVGMNGLKDRVDLRRCALGRAPGEATIVVAGSHTGNGSLLREGEGASVPVEVGAAALGALPDGPLLLKIDVEGFEEEVLGGLGALLDRPEVALLIEVTPEWLAAAGGSAEALFASLQERGFEAYLVRRGNGQLRRLEAVPLEGPTGEAQYDVLFARPASLHAARIAPFVRRDG